MTRISVAQAAEELNMNVLAVRYFMKTGQLNIGYVMDRPGGKRATFYCFMEAVQAEKRRLNGEQGDGTCDSDRHSIGECCGDCRDKESDELA